MSRSTQRPKESSFYLRIDPALKAAFTRATAAEDKPAAQVMRDLMRAYVKQRERRAFEAEARRQSRGIATAAKDAGSDEAAVMRWIEDVADTDGWVG